MREKRKRGLLIGRKDERANCPKEYQVVVIQSGGKPGIDPFLLVHY